MSVSLLLERFRFASLEVVLRKWMLVITVLPSDVKPHPGVK